jgi:uncharacterized cupredoxin-like copper-binding protein
MAMVDRHQRLDSIPMTTQPSRVSGLARMAAALSVAAAGVACEAGPPPPTPPITPGSSAAPREVNIIAKDWQFLPPTVDLVPGETVLFHIVNGGLEIHEVVIGDRTVQDAWEAAEAATVGHPPGPTPAVSVPPEVAGLRVVVASGQRVDVTWTVPSDVPAGVAADQLLVGCHIPGHWEKGMVVPIRLVQPGASP